MGTPDDEELKKQLPNTISILESLTRRRPWLPRKSPEQKSEEQTGGEKDGKD